jgi:hypothetical protein
LLETSGTTNVVVVGGTATFTMTETNVVNANLVSGTLDALVNIANTGLQAARPVIQRCSITYTGTTTDVGVPPRKCCINFGASVASSLQITDSFLICQGATTTTGGVVQVIQRRGTGSPSTLFFGGLLTQSNTTAYSAAITKVPFAFSSLTAPEAQINTISPLDTASVSISDIVVSTLNSVVTTNSGGALYVADFISPFVTTTLLNATNANIVEDLTIDPSGRLQTNLIEPFDTFSTVFCPSLGIVSPDGSITFGTSGGNITAVVPSTKQATYYKNAPQNLTSGNTIVTFDLSGAWNNEGGYIAQTSSTNFTVSQEGLYQLEFHLLVFLNGGSWTTSTNKVAAIDITRSPAAETAVIAQSSLQAVAGYTQSVNGTYYLLSNDIIRLRVNNTFTGTPVPQVIDASGFDLNTFFAWTYIT